MPSANLDPDVATLRDDVRNQADCQAIADLISGLGAWLDDKRFDDARSILTEDVTAETPGGSARGIDAVAEQARRNHDNDRTQHVITDVLIDVAGDQATARANVVATFVAPDDDTAPHYTTGARYRLQAVRAPQGWRLSRVQVTPVWASGARPAATPSTS